MTKDEIRQMFYSASPHNLGPDEDNEYRDAIDHVLHKLDVSAKIKSY
jgi:hypothetical protein